MDKKVTIITGASRGIGAGIALALAQAGWSIVINYRGNKKAADKTAENIQNLGGKCLLVQADISNNSDRQNLLDQTIQKFGQIDLLINNAGMAPKQRLDILETTEESYDQVMSVNLKGPFFLSQLIANEMVDLIQSKKIKNPRIVNIGSISAYVSSPNRGEYCLSKAGMGMMTALFADRLAEFGIGVYEVRPGIIETDMTSGVKQKYDKLIGDGLTPIRRWGKPDDVAKAVVSIAEGNFPFSTGEIINVDGGFHMQRL
jgi:3-oxoacyl-[acyl-carrier protein] reductase